MLNAKSPSSKKFPELQIKVKNISKSFNQKRVLKSLESMATVPNSRYGDSLLKVKNSFESLLRGQGLPVDVNVAVILSQNEMEINKENFNAVKSLRDSIQQLRDDLHPVEAALLFTEGKNPLDMTVDDMREFHDSLPDYGDNTGGRLAENILALDNDLDADVRNAVVNLYRCFSAVDQNGGVAVGALIAAGKSATLGNLLDEAQNFGNRADYTAGGDHVEHVQSDGIREMIAKGLSKARVKLTT